MYWITSSTTKKCIYTTGSDVNVNKYNVTPLENPNNIDDYSVAGVKDVGPDYVKTAIGLDKNAEYINAGVLLINLEKWRRINIEDKFIKLLEEQFAGHQLVQHLKKKQHIFQYLLHLQMSLFFLQFDNLLLESFFLFLHGVLRKCEVGFRHRHQNVFREIVNLPQRRDCLPKILDKLLLLFCKPDVASHKCAVRIGSECIVGGYAIHCKSLIHRLYLNHRPPARIHNAARLDCGRHHIKNRPCTTFFEVENTIFVGSVDAPRLQKCRYAVHINSTRHINPLARKEVEIVAIKSRNFFQRQPLYQGSV